MTEQEWLACQAPEPLLRYLLGAPEVRPFGWFQWFLSGTPKLEPAPTRPVISDRKQRLLAVAYCRRVAELLADPSSCAALDVAEKYADRLVGQEELATAETDAARAAMVAFDGSRSTGLDAVMLRDRSHHRAAANAALAVLEAIRGDTTAATGAAAAAAMDVADSEFDRVWAVAALGAPAQLRLIRHLFDNPFRLSPAPPCWPAAVMALAEAVYDGADAAFALHDALLEAGHPDLAEHFATEQWHPKGCWAVDLILGRS
jgi:hypothetical protein